MALIERTLYPRFPATFSRQELNANYTPTAQEIELAYRNVRGESSVLNFLALLKAFQQLQYFPHPVEIPLAISRHIHTCLAFKASQFTDYPPRSLVRYKNTIRHYLGLQPYDRKARKLILTALLEAAAVREELADLINLAIETLHHQHYELPVFSALETMARRVRKLVNSRYFHQLEAKLTPEYQQLLDELVLMPPKGSGLGKGRASLFHRLKTPPKYATLTHLREWQKHLEWLGELGPVEQWLEGVPLTKIQHLAQQAYALDGGDLGEVATARRHTLLACLIYQTRRKARDSLVEMFIKRMAAIHKQAQEWLTELREEHRTTTEQLVDTLNDVLELNTTEGQSLDDASFGKSVREALSEHGGSDSLLLGCEQVRAYHGNNHLPLLNRFYKSHRTALFRLVRSLKIGSTTQEKALLEALNLILQYQSSQAKWLPDELSLEWANEAWQKLIRVRRRGKQLYRLDRRMLEMGVLSYLALELRTGDLYVADSEEWADYRSQLLSWEECQPQLADYCRSLGLASEAKGFVAQLRATLMQSAEQVDLAIPTSESVALR